MRRAGTRQKAPTDRPSVRVTSWRTRVITPRGMRWCLFLTLQLLVWLDIGTVSSQGSTTSTSGSTQDSTDGDTVVNGVLELLSSDAIENCSGGCKSGLAQAFDVEETSIGCDCPSLGSSSRRRLFDSVTRRDADLSLHLRPRRLSGDDQAGAAFAVRISGGLSAGVESLENFIASIDLVAGAFNVSKSDVRETDSRLELNSPQDRFRLSSRPLSFMCMVCAGSIEIIHASVPPFRGSFRSRSMSCISRSPS